VGSSLDADFEMKMSGGGRKVRGIRACRYRLCTGGRYPTTGTRRDACLGRAGVAIRPPLKDGTGGTPLESRDTGGGITFSRSSAERLIRPTANGTNPNQTISDWRPGRVRLRVQWRVPRIGFWGIGDPPCMGPTTHSLLPHPSRLR
jgi:hypothetical protein